MIPVVCVEEGAVEATGYAPPPLCSVSSSNWTILLVGCIGGAVTDEKGKKGWG